MCSHQAEVFLFIRVRGKDGTGRRGFSYLEQMEDCSSQRWVEAQVADSVHAWQLSAARSLPQLPRYSVPEQRKREKAYDKSLQSVEREARCVQRSPALRKQAQQRIVEAFPRFAIHALGLEDEAVALLTNGFFPVGTQLARWARGFDAELSIADTVQASRNAWICCGAQALLGLPMELTPSILAYSLLYPYSDNYLDQPELPAAEKLRFSERFRRRLRGERLSALDPREAAIWSLVQMIEEQYDRQLHPQVYLSLLAIHDAQEASLAQLQGGALDNRPRSSAELLRISCAKGGTSVLADAFLAQPHLSREQSRFAFEWGVLLQLGDDLQDVREDRARGSATLFTRAAAEGEPLDGLVMQLLRFSQRVAERMDALPHGSESLKGLLRMSWRSLILMAVADAQDCFTPAFLAELEPCSSFRFDFLRARNQKLAGRKEIYETLFDTFLEVGEDGTQQIACSKQQPVDCGQLLAVNC